MTTFTEKQLHGVEAVAITLYKLSMDSLKIVKNDSGTEKATVRVTGGIEPEDIMSAINKVDFKVSKKEVLR